MKHEGVKIQVVSRSGEHLAFENPKGTALFLWGKNLLEYTIIVNTRTKVRHFLPSGTESIEELETSLENFCKILIKDSIEQQEQDKTSFAEALACMSEGFGVFSPEQIAEAFFKAGCEQGRKQATQAEPQEPVAVVPNHCTGAVFVFEGGVLNVNKDGSGNIVVEETNFQYLDSECSWVAKFEASEILALRDFLNTHPPHLEQAVKQYYYKVNECKGFSPDCANCICWHDIGTGPLANHSEDQKSFRNKAATPSEVENPLLTTLKNLLPWVVSQEVACHGVKCREAVCMSCNSDSAESAKRATQAKNEAYAALSAAEAAAREHGL